MFRVVWFKEKKVLYPENHTSENEIAIKLIFLDELEPSFDIEVKLYGKDTSKHFFSKKISNEIIKVIKRKENFSQIIKELPDKIANLEEKVNSYRKEKKLLYHLLEERNELKAVLRKKE